MWETQFKLIARVRASVDIVPKGSQVVVLSLVVVFALCLGCAFYFIWLGINYWPPLISAGIVFFVVVPFWLLSHRRVDDRGAPPVELSMVDGSYSAMLKLPARGSSLNDQLEVIERSVSAMRSRQPLPQPNGIVDKSGNPVPKSQGEATRRVNAANDEARKAADELQSYVNKLDRHTETEQSKRAIIPNVQELEELNKPGTDGKTAT